MEKHVEIIYIGGPTFLIEYGTFRLLVDPTFDPAGTDYPTPIYTLHKTQDPALSVREVGAIDAVLLSHDHHFDNLDNSGREYLKAVPRVLTTKAGAERLGNPSEGFEAWDQTTLEKSEGSVKVTATPARHGPPDGDRGPVVGFVLENTDLPTVYLSGDTVWYEGVKEVSRRFHVDVALLFMGAAVVPEVGPAHLTFTAGEGVEAAKVFPYAVIVPVHYEGWAHFSDSRPDIEKAFVDAGLNERLLWLPPGVRTTI
jgi:L-ascorbate metabolism protein UlaG (beta-lactamase superfamily)